MAKNSKKTNRSELATKRRRSRIRRENVDKRLSSKEAEEYPSIPGPLATFDILWRVLDTGVSDTVMLIAREIPPTKNFAGKYKHDDTVQRLNIALGVQTLVAYHGLVATLGSGGRAKDELRALEVGIGDIDYRLMNGRKNLTQLTAFESENDLQRSILNRCAAIDHEAATGALREQIQAETQGVRLIFRAYQRAQIVVEAERKSVGRSADDSSALQERAFKHDSSSLSPIEACQVAYLADINPAELWIHYAEFFGKTFELARFVGRVNAGIEAMLSPDLFGLCGQVLTAQSQETDLAVLWISLRQRLNLTFSTRKFRFALHIAELVNGTIRVARAMHARRPRELTIEEQDRSRYAIVENRDGTLMVIALGRILPAND